MKAQMNYADFANVEQYIKYCQMDNTRIQLSYANLSYANLSNADLRAADLRNADLRNADLRNANLRAADLRNADLRNANLRYADLSYADLSYANLSYANLYGANLSGATLSNATLSNADLYGANLSSANLYGANLGNADLRAANLRNAEYDSTTAGFALACPEEGSFVAWKKLSNFIIKLKVPEDAKRSSATTRKCRCSHAVVLDIQNIDGTSAGIDALANYAYSNTTQYIINGIVVADKFDEDRWNECSNGIHFFITRQEAVQY